MTHDDDHAAELKRRKRHLTDLEAFEVHLACEVNGMTQQAAAARWGVSIGTVTNICAGKGKWKGLLKRVEAQKNQTPPPAPPPRPATAQLPTVEDPAPPRRPARVARGFEIIDDTTGHGTWDRLRQRRRALQA